MPNVTFINDTQVPLHICLKQVSPLHYANAVPPNGGTATMHTGRVWFTIQARIDRGDNSYDKFQTYAPIAAITIGVLSVASGAIYFAGAAAAAGGTVAAASAVAARITAAVATHTPTAKRLLKYATKGQAVAKIGQVVGIGGGALAGAKGAGGKPKPVEKQIQEKAAEASKSALKKLLQGSVLSSAGWYIDRDRTIRITGGPNASITDGLLVIETDTTIPFTLVDETGKTVAVGNEAGGEPVPPNPTEGDDLDDTEDAARLNPAPGESIAMGIGSATAAAAASGGAPVLQAEGAQQEKTKDGFWMRTFKGGDKH
ncbi:hypothetical protein PSEUBRA_000050 [Kalmanozyma brasiliensis GHG001]|uniref:Uncharacterized protein n=1 Tax=Kalmanozyma brasiliensis (strain GHG001) TaxID=1365824 RepID=V5GUT9_KALBG|nr:uncharacterized protein PSEUBRA_000050 [Kalmanozyma brasiliensis GHG001]EST09677.1 hypothetical protein PSEUBRA_000050 [Kalmanozyma brasiliensis GHG001]